MARKSLIIKAKRKPKFKVRAYTRCSICGRPHQYIEISEFVESAKERCLGEGSYPWV